MHLNSIVIHSFAPLQTYKDFTNSLIFRLKKIYKDKFKPPIDDQGKQPPIPKHTIDVIKQGIKNGEHLKIV